MFVIMHLERQGNLPFLPFLHVILEVSTKRGVPCRMGFPLVVVVVVSSPSPSFS